MRGDGRTAATARARVVAAVVALAAIAVSATTACGYHALAGGGVGTGAATADAPRLHVRLARSRIADAIASDEVVSGAREELAREGALAPGDGYPRVEIEVLRADEQSEGIAAERPGGAAALVPRARATDVGLVARAWIVRAAGAAPERDTGDVRAFDVVTAGDPGGAADAIHHAEALRAAARRVGERLARRLLGDPTASDEAIGREQP